MFPGSFTLEDRSGRRVSTSGTRSLACPAGDSHLCAPHITATTIGTSRPSKSPAPRGPRIPTLGVPVRWRDVRVEEPLCSRANRATAPPCSSTRMRHSPRVYTDPPMRPHGCASVKPRTSRPAPPSPPCPQLTRTRRRLLPSKPPASRSPTTQVLRSGGSGEPACVKCAPRRVSSSPSRLDRASRRGGWDRAG